MDVKFDFENEGENYFGKVYRPIALVSFKTQKTFQWTEILMIVDSGADFSILPKYLSDDLEISFENDCIKDSTIGVGGTQAVYLYKSRIDAKIGSFVRKVPLAFFDNDQVPPLLGRQGFLETFDTEFLRSHTVVFKE